MWILSTVILVFIILNCKGQSDFGNWLEKNIMEPLKYLEANLEKAFNKEYNQSNPWDCGSDSVPITRSAAKISVLLSCPNSKDLVNEACRAHDICYINQLGQQVCDNEFCQRLQSIQFQAEERHSCNVTTLIMCDIVHKFGRDSYEQAVLNKLKPT